MRFNGRLGRAIDDAVRLNLAEVRAGICESCDWETPGNSGPVRVLGNGAADECPRHYLASVTYWETREGFTTEAILDHAEIAEGVGSQNWTTRTRARRAIYAEYARRFRLAFGIADAATDAESVQP